MTVRLERPIHYGNAGLAFSESRPTDDAYLFKPENTRDVWSHIRTITERYGYDFGTTEDGDFLLATRNNAHAVVELTATSVKTQAPTAVVTEETHPNAYAGAYLEFVGPVPTFSYTVNAARIDIAFPVGKDNRAPAVNLGSWLVTVKQGATVVAGPLTVDPSGAENLQFYDARSTVDGTNATVVTAYTGYYNTYTVHFVSTGGDSTTRRRLDSLMLWHTDPAHPLYPSVLSTDQNATSAAARSTMDEMRNYVIVVGRRRAVVTDSSKVITNPENTVDEFYVSSGVDVASVTDPTASNYIGYGKGSLIYDNSITDQDFADYLARTFIYRQRQPAPNASVAHTLLPAVELRDPVYVVESQYETLDASVVQRVVGITHRVGTNEAMTTLETTSYAEFPSYEVREDIDIDARFNGQPVAGVTIGYTGLTGVYETNRAGGRAKVSPDSDLITVLNKPVVGDAIDMSGESWPPLPGCVYLTPTATGAPTSSTTVSGSAGFVMMGGKLNPVECPGIVGAPTLVTVTWSFSAMLGLNDVGATVTIGTNPSGAGDYYYVFDSTLGGGTVQVYRKGPATLGAVVSAYCSVTYDAGHDTQGGAYQTNTPYHHLLEVDYRDSNRSIALPWKQGDGTAKYRRASTSMAVTYRRLGPVNAITKAFEDPYGGNSPFYDPYSSELGYLVDIGFDALVSGRYRVSIRSVYDDTVVAWLTEPTLAATDEEAHWQYMTAGKGRSFSWDGVDQVGTWNRRQSEGYAAAAHGAFEQGQKPLVGAGFYAWNCETSASGLPSQALIAGTRDANGKPVFGQGQYAEWYVRFEVTNDRLQEIADRAKVTGGTLAQRSAVRVVNSTTMNETGVAADAYSGRIYTHLPEPTKVELTVHDWKWGATGLQYDPTDTGALNTGANWVTGDIARGANLEGVVNNQKPVRMRFAPVSRPGVLWDGQDDLISFKLNRQVHLRVNLADQFVMFAGTNFKGQDVENRRVVTRRLTNDDHTLNFVDSGFRQRTSLKTADGGDGMEWIFSPRDFRKDFRGTPDEQLVFGDYLQLEEVPGWTTDRSVAGSRSRLQIAFMSYLFYLSAYTQDRSGRYTWCLNREFLDKSKIVQNVRTDYSDSAKPTQWPDNMNLQFRRSVIVRQWTDERVSPTKTWRDDQAERWQLGTTTSSTGYALLRHKWKEHEVTGTQEVSDATGLPIGHTNWWRLKTLGGVAMDDYSHWHTDGDHDGPGAGNLPSSFTHQLQRQLGAASGAPILGLWTFEPAPLWIPSVTRDFHGYHHMPPMCDSLARDNDLVYNKLYDTPDYRGYKGDDQEEASAKNTGGDPAVSPVWNSPVLDMTAPPTLGQIKKVGVRFFQGRVVTPDKEPTKTVPSNCIDYQRQSDLVYFEDLRGIYSRGPRPQEQPKKVISGNPYYQNPYEYSTMYAVTARKQQKLLPLYRANVVKWFTFTFRSEYVWESSRFFPTEQYGKERIGATNVERARHLDPREVSNVRYDVGAWTGWKDDHLVNGTSRVTGETDVYTGQVLSTTKNIFGGAYMPVSTGPLLSVTRDLIMHLVLVNERREATAL